MDVTCEQCNTGYEFDDALVSERGTTVKCTTCGHLFKVRRAQPTGAPERWAVRTIDGRQFEFGALRELQAAIAQTLISREDVLSRGGSRPRRLGSIAELEPFFASAGAPNVHATSLGLGPRVPGRVRVDMGGPGSGGASAPPRIEGSIAIPLREFVSDDERTVLRPSLAGLPPAPISRPLPTPASLGSFGSPGPRPSERRNSTPSISERVPPAFTAGEPQPTLSASPPSVPEVLVAADDSNVVSATEETAPRSQRAGVPGVTGEEYGTEPAPDDDRESVLPPTPAPLGTRLSFPSGEHFGGPSRRTSALRWIVGLFVTGTLALALATLGRRVLTSPATARGTDASGRIEALLNDGEKTLLEGNIDLAKEQFDKASGLSERDPRVVVGLARLAATKADFVWLRLRLVAPEDPEHAEIQRELDLAAQQARTAIGLADQVVPSEVSVIRSRITALRLVGDLDGARRLVGAISSTSAQPENALTLAELDLAESNPDWSTVIGRLRVALTGEQNLGRARSVLVYALARSGDIVSARIELDRLGALPRPHPLFKALRLYLSRLDRTAVGGGPGVSADPRSGAKAPPTSATGRPAKGRPASGLGDTKDWSRPNDPVAPTGAVDTSDLNGAKVLPSPAPVSSQLANPGSSLPPAVDTSDLPGFK